MPLPHVPLSFTMADAMITILQTLFYRYNYSVKYPYWYYAIV